MFIIFGWEREFKRLDNIMHLDCYSCQNHTQWSILKETEWVSLFFIKVLPIINNYYVACTCGDATKISSQQAKMALTPTTRTQKLHDELVKKIEEKQFGGLTDAQIQFRKTNFERKNNF